MSVWTHVAITLRIDTLRMMGVDLNRHDIDQHFSTDIPSGSEGPLCVVVYENPNVNSLAAYVVTIWGDLRHWDDADAVVDWITHRASLRDKAFIRQGAGVVEVEGGVRYALVFGTGALDQVSVRTVRLDTCSES